MNYTKIGWVLNDDGSQGFTWNPLKGRCPNACPYCYAEDIRKRFKMYDGPLKLDYAELQRPLKRKKPCTIFVCSMNELFGPWVDGDWVADILNVTRMCDHRFLFLTKFPDQMWSWAPRVPLLQNSWQGVTITDFHDAPRMRLLQRIHDRQMKTFVSFEPLLGSGLHIVQCDYYPEACDWLIVGSLNKNGRAVPAEKGGTRIEWVWPILERADKLGIPVFLKKELLRLYPELPKRREVPWVKN